LNDKRKKIVTRKSGEVRPKYDTGTYFTRAFDINVFIRDFILFPRMQPLFLKNPSFSIFSNVSN